MARKPMVTRTITTTEANVMCLNIKTGEPFNKTIVLPRTYKDEQSLMKMVSSVVDNEEEKGVHVVEKKEVEILYGMSEQDFIKYATVLTPRDKENDTDDGANVENEGADTTEAEVSEPVEPTKTSKKSKNSN